jgi:hypothetical protein
MQKPSLLQRRLKDLDLFKRLPKNVAKGSLLGVIMTIICLSTVGILLFHEIIAFMSTEIESSMRIDHRKDDQHVEVHLSIDFQRFPCYLLGLDVTDYVGTHRTAEHDTMNFYTLDTNGNILDKANVKLGVEETVAAFNEAYDKNYGCRMEGYFSILLVPGNFHIGFHSRGAELERLIQQRGPFNVDFTHRINTLYFGSTKNNQMYRTFQSDFNLKSLQTLTGYSSTQMVPQPGPFSYRYKLLIVPTDLIYEDGTEHDIFQYKSFWNVASVEMNFNYLISVDYELSSLSMVEKQKHKYKSEFIIHISGIVGGLVAFMTFIHSLVQRSVIRLLYKAGLGKLE